MKKRVLVVEPYYGGSHKQFLDGLRQNIEADFCLLTLPARKWKMRMQLSAPWFARCVDKLKNRHFDTVLCSTFVDVAVLKALLTQISGWNSACCFCTYFHENQFAYPHRKEDTAHHQFTAINFTTALVSDRVAFNSRYNWNSFIDSSSKLVKKAADIELDHQLMQLQEKSAVLYPGIDFSHFVPILKKTNAVPVICWNHRWEHDKDPETFFQALEELDNQGYDFRLVILGQSFRDIPPVFIRAKERFRNKIKHFGYASTRAKYLSLMQRCDIVVSTAIHEFFGISVVEAVRAGCVPLVPDRLSYPELYGKRYRYRDGELSLKLSQMLTSFQRQEMEQCRIDTDRFSWQALKRKYERWLFDKAIDIYSEKCESPDGTGQFVQQKN